MKTITPMENIQMCAKGICAAVMAYLAPIEGSMTALIAVLVANMATGILVGVGFQREPFQFKKAFRAFQESALIALLIAAIFFLAERNGDPTEGVMIVSYAVYVAVLIYSQNIVKNLLRVYPDCKFLLVLNFFLAFEFLRIFAKIRGRAEVTPYERYNEKEKL